MKEEHRKILEKHYTLYQKLLLDHYLPRGTEAAIQELNGLWVTLGNPPAKLSCETCVRQLLTNLYRNYNAN